MMKKFSFLMLATIFVSGCGETQAPREKIAVINEWRFNGCQITKIKIWGKEESEYPIFLAKCDGNATQTITQQVQVREGKSTITQQRTTITVNSDLDKKCQDLENSKAKALGKLTKEEKEILGLK